MTMYLAPMRCRRGAREQAERGARSMADGVAAVCDRRRSLDVQNRLGTVRGLGRAERRIADQRRVQRAALSTFPGQAAQLHRHRGRRRAAADLLHGSGQVVAANDVKRKRTVWDSPQTLRKTRRRRRGAHKSVLPRMFDRVKAAPSTPPPPPGALRTTFYTICQTYILSSRTRYNSIQIVHVLIHLFNYFG